MALILPQVAFSVAGTTMMRNVVMRIPRDIFCSEYEQVGRPKFLLTTDDGRIVYYSSQDMKCHIYKIDGVLPYPLTRDIYWARDHNNYYRIPPCSIFMTSIYNTFGKDPKGARFEFENQPKFVVFMEMQARNRPQYVSSTLGTRIAFPNIQFEKLQGAVIVVPKCIEEQARQVFHERMKNGLSIPSITVADIDEPLDLPSMMQSGPLSATLKEIITLNVPLMSIPLRPLSDLLLAPEPISHILYA